MTTMDQSVCIYICLQESRRAAQSSPDTRFVVCLRNQLDAKAIFRPGGSRAVVRERFGDFA
jgi:hypothetical protein